MYVNSVKTVSSFAAEQLNMKSQVQQHDAVVTASRCSGLYSKTCLKRNVIVPVFFFPFSQVSVLQRVVF